VTPWVLGLDLGQASDFSALVVLERALWIGPRAADRLLLEPGWHWPGGLHPAWVETAWAELDGRPAGGPLAITYAKRWSLRTAYPEIVKDLAALVSQPPLSPDRVILAVDQTGVGAPVVDLLRQVDIPNLCSIVITAGNTVAPDPSGHWGFRTPKRDLVSAVAVALEQRRLKIAAALPEAATLTAELETFKRTVTPAGSDQYSAWRERDHDDLVLALALAVWLQAFLTAETETALALLALAGRG
jgi:hypothetical protein